MLASIISLTLSTIALPQEVTDSGPALTQAPRTAKLIEVEPGWTVFRTLRSALIVPAVAIALHGGNDLLGQAVFDSLGGRSNIVAAFVAGSAKLGVLAITGTASMVLTVLTLAVTSSSLQPAHLARAVPLAAGMLVSLLIVSLLITSVGLVPASLALVSHFSAVFLASVATPIIFAATQPAVPRGVTVATF